MPAWFFAVLSPFVSVASAWALWHLTQKRAEAKAEAGDEKTWRKARLDEERRLDEKITAETQARVKWELENAGDLARIVELLKEVGRTQELLATVAANSKHNTSDIAELKQQLGELRTHLNQFILSHVSRPA